MKKSPLERLMDTHPGLEIWWDSSPLIYDSWLEGVVKKAPPERAGWRHKSQKWPPTASGSPATYQGDAFGFGASAGAVL